MNEAIETGQAATMMAPFEEVRAFSNGQTFYSWGHADIVRIAGVRGDLLQRVISGGDGVQGAHEAAVPVRRWQRVQWQ